MEMTQLGRTGLEVSRTSFGALPIQRADMETAARILRRALDGGINFIDTARAYSDSEKKIGHALSDRREEFYLATKTASTTRSGVLNEIETSLTNLKTDHVDVLQLHNPETLPDPDDADGSYAGLLQAREQGHVRFIGVTAHRLPNALAAARSGHYDTVQFPLSAVSAEEDLALVDVCREANVGLLAMKALCGGLLINIPAAFAFLRQFRNVVPIWGIQRESELDEFLALEADPPEMDADMRRRIAEDREELAGEFCRGCGYCLPCPAEIPIPMAARMKYLLRRAPTENFLTPEWQEKMRRIHNCKECGKCMERCPYGLSTPEILKRMLEDYETFLA